MGDYRSEILYSDLGFVKYTLRVPIVKTSTEGGYSIGVDMSYLGMMMSEGWVKEGVCKRLLVEPPKVEWCFEK